MTETKPTADLAGRPMEEPPTHYGSAKVEPRAYRGDSPPEGRSLFTYFGRYLLAPEEAKQKGAVFVEQEAPPVGVVLEPEWAAGRRVLFQKFTGTEFTLNGEARLIVEGEHILMWLEEGDEIET